MGAQQPPQPSALWGSAWHSHTAVSIPSPTTPRPHHHHALQCHSNDPLADPAILLWMVSLPKEAQFWLEKPNVR